MVGNSSFVIRIRYDWEIWSKLTKLVFFLTWEIRVLIFYLLTNGFFYNYLFIFNLYNVVSFVVKIDFFLNFLFIVNLLFCIGIN